MIAGVRPRTILVMPRRAWRVFMARAPKASITRERKQKLGVIATFEHMLESQVHLMFRDLTD
jgi:hypothetical protein